MKNEQHHCWRLLNFSHFQTGETITLSQDEHHYAHHVLRLTKNQEIEISDCAGTIAHAVILETSKKTTTVQIKHTEFFEHERPIITLAVGYTKPQTIEEIIATSSELGAQRIHIIRMDNSHHRQEAKLEKWLRISKESTRINKSAWCAQVGFYETLQDYLNGLNPNAMIYTCDESLLLDEKKALPLLKAVRSKKSQFAEHVLLVGPEASFSASEKHQISQHKNATFVTLGKNILRVPTAASYGLSCILAEMAELI